MKNIEFRYSVNIYYKVLKLFNSYITIKLAFGLNILKFEYVL